MEVHGYLRNLSQVGFKGHQEQVWDPSLYTCYSQARVPHPLPSFLGSALKMLPFLRHKATVFWPCSSGPKDLHRHFPKQGMGHKFLLVSFKALSIRRMCLAFPCLTIRLSHTVPTASRELVIRQGSGLSGRSS